jgi:pSer/pThr/pTyr-binding forkhead associated (FHA) protein
VAESGTGIGRDTGNAVQLSSPEVSKQHAFLQRTATGWAVRDLKSRNGLFVNGKRVVEVDLSDGDRLSIGPYTLVFEIAEAGRTYKPMLQIDLSDKAAQQTMPAQRKPAGRA